MSVDLLSEQWCSDTGDVVCTAGYIKLKENEILESIHRKVCRW